MAKKQNGSRKAPSKPAAKAMTAADHRKIAETHHARARIHSAQADLMDAKNPPKNKGRMPGSLY